MAGDDPTITTDSAKKRPASSTGDSLVTAALLAEYHNLTNKAGSPDAITQSPAIKDSDPDHQHGQFDIFLFEKSGIRKTEYPNGTVIEKYPDGREFERTITTNGDYTLHHTGPQPEDNYSIERKSDTQGSYTEKHTGQRPEDNYEIIQSNHQYFIFEKPGQPPVDKTAYDDKHPDSRVERARLLDTAKLKINSIDEQKRFINDMDTFETRARKQGLSQEQQAQLYHQVGKLLETEDQPDKSIWITKGQRIEIAEQIMSHAADPHIDQGDHSTCTVAALESQMFTKDPADASRLIVEVATTGQFVTTSGTVIKPHASILYPYDEASRNPPDDDTRSYASQLFQGTAVTIEYPGYQQKNPSPETSDTGECVDNHTPCKEFTGLSAAQILDVNKQITGDRNPVVYIQRPMPEPDPSDPSAQDTKKNIDRLKQQGEIKEPNNEAEFKKCLEELKNSGQLPAIMQIDARNEPFWADLQEESATGWERWHAITITDYNHQDGTVAISNQWGSSSDHKSIPVQELYPAIYQWWSYEHSQALDNAIEQNDKTGKVDPILQLESLRQQFQLHQPMSAEGRITIADPHFRDKLIVIMRAARRELHSNEDIQRINEEFIKLLDLASPSIDEQIQIMKQVEQG